MWDADAIIMRDGQLQDTMLTNPSPCRRYTNGSWLTAHVDRFNTHVVSAILNIKQAVTEEWPLYIMECIT